MACLQVQAAIRGERLHLIYLIRGEIPHLLLPPAEPPVRADDLWRQTCLEAFIRQPDGSYWEFNFSPSSQWAAYAFSGYRSGMTDLSIPPPDVTIRTTSAELRVEVELHLPHALDRPRLNLTAVIEEKGGAKSYWALAHPPEGPPDFHHPDCFVLELPPPETP